MYLVEGGKAHRGRGYRRLVLMAILIAALMTGTLCTRVTSVITTPDVYWVEAGAIGDGTSEANSAGNISYVLGLGGYIPPYTVGPFDTIKVKPGMYDAAAGEVFPILVGVGDVTIESTVGAEVTVIDGGGVPEVVVIAAHGVNFRGFTVKSGTMCIKFIEAPKSASRVSGCIVIDAEYGICFFDTYENVVENSTISDNWRGIWIDEESHDNIITDNTISNNDIGIDIGGYNTIITDNAISNNGHGIWIDGWYENLIFGNTITGNLMVDSGIHVGKYTKGTIVHFNNIMDNSGAGNYGIMSELQDVSADYNWWGDVTGPYHPTTNPDGRGDNVTDHVAYLPWSGSPIVATYYEIVPLDGEQHVIDGTAETGVKVTATTTLPGSPDEVIVIIAKYAGNPHPESFPSPDIPLDVFFDMWIRWPWTVEWPIHVEVTYSDEQVRSAGISEPSLGLYHYVYTDRFYRCGDTGIVKDRNIVWANIPIEEYGETALTPFAIGGKPKPVGGVIIPASKLQLLAPWIGLCAVFSVVIAIIMIKKHRT